jgi:hypothetical protein
MLLLQRVCFAAASIAAGVRIWCTHHGQQALQLRCCHWQHLDWEALTQREPCRPTVVRVHAPASTIAAAAATTTTLTINCVITDAAATVIASPAGLSRTAAAAADLLQDLLSLLWQLLLLLLGPQLLLLLLGPQLLLKPLRTLPLLCAPLPPPLLARLPCRLLRVLQRRANLLLRLGLLLLNVHKQILQIEVLCHALACALRPVAHTEQCRHQHGPQLRHRQILLWQAAQAL